jgi:predicted transcriptional regulator
MTSPLRIAGKADTKLQIHVDRTLARRVDALAKKHDVSRAAAARAVLEHYVPEA